MAVRAKEGVSTKARVDVDTGHLSHVVRQWIELGIDLWVVTRGTERVGVPRVVRAGDVGIIGVGAMTAGAGDEPGWVSIKAATSRLLAFSRGLPPRKSIKALSPKR